MRIAVIDPGSFVLPYDYQLVQALAGRGDEVDFYGSTTRYNGEFLEAMRRLHGVTVRAQAISRTVASRGRAALAYAWMLLSLLVRARRYDLVNLQFSGFWPAELLVLGLLRRQFVFTVHNAVPHGFSGVQHAPTRRLARLAHTLVFVSAATRDDFMRRYGEGFRARSRLLPHGLLPVSPASEPIPYGHLARARALVFWSNVQPYKGVELFADLARAQSVRSRGLALAVHGAWASELAGLKAELIGLGVAVHDHYLSRDELQQLLAQDVVFLLPYQRASQSGALYSLLNHGCVFICADVGDLGAFMRRFGLEGLLLKERSAAAVEDCLRYLETHAAEVSQALARAQQALRWERVLADADGAYGG